MAPIPRSTHKKKPKKYSKGRRARRVDGREEDINEQNRGLGVVFFFPPFIQRHPIHCGHSLLRQSNSATEGRPRTFTKRSVEHNVLRSVVGVDVFFGLV